MRINKSVLGAGSPPIVVDMGMQRMQLPRNIHPRRRQTSYKTQRKMGEKTSGKQLETLLTWYTHRDHLSFGRPHSTNR
jgi:hypothetical protein